jgi:hypothetical protein
MMPVWLMWRLAKPFRIPSAMEIADAGADYVIVNQVTRRGKPACSDFIQPGNRSEIDLRLYRLVPGL